MSDSLESVYPGIEYRLRRRGYDPEQIFEILLIVDDVCHVCWKHECDCPEEEAED